MSFGAEKLTENYNALMGAIVKAKPAAAKGQYIQQLRRRVHHGPRREDEHGKAGLKRLKEGIPSPLSPQGVRCIRKAAKPLTAVQQIPCHPAVRTRGARTLAGCRGSFVRHMPRRRMDFIFFRAAGLETALLPGRKEKILNICGNA